MSVVYRTIPTSNHNVAPPQEDFNVLYIVLFLHQTTTKVVCVIFPLSCISYYSYIKPQLIEQLMIASSVVYRTIPTSNHNWLM